MKKYIYIISICLFFCLSCGIPSLEEIKQAIEEEIERQTGEGNGTDDGNGTGDGSGNGSGTGDGNGSDDANEELAALVLTVDLAEAYEDEGVLYYPKSNSAGNPNEVTLSYSATGDDDISYEVKLNGKIASSTNNAIKISDAGLTTILVMAKDSYERTVYAQRKIFIDTQLPEVVFVNSNTQVRLDQISEYTDGVPPTALIDSGSGVNFESGNGWWEDGTPTAAGVAVRYFSIRDNAGNESLPYALDVTVTPIPVYPLGMAIVTSADPVENGTLFNLQFTNSPTDKGATWSSSNEAILKFEENSAVVLAAGEVEVTATSNMVGDNGETFTATKSVTTSALPSKRVNGTNMRLVYSFDFTTPDMPTQFELVTPGDFSIDTSDSGYLAYTATNNVGLNRSLSFATNFANEAFTYVELSFKYNSSTLASNILVHRDGPLGFRFSKGTSTGFLINDWDVVSGGEQSYTLNNSGGINTIGFLETETGGVISTNGTEYVKTFSRPGYLYNNGVGNFSVVFNTDSGGSESTIVYVDYIRFYVED